MLVLDVEDNGSDWLYTNWSASSFGDGAGDGTGGDTIDLVQEELGVDYKRSVAVDIRVGMESDDFDFERMRWDWTEHNWDETWWASEALGIHKRNPLNSRKG